jgi:predicted NAD-dependent protein-ADP-ribosyltransferase YbiA (DUF1768 family)
MRIRVAGRYLTLTAESETERSDLLAVAGEVAGQQFRVDTVNEDGMSLRVAGPLKAETETSDRSLPDRAQREGPQQAPAGLLNITYDVTPMPLRLISNLAETSFELDGRWYSSVEGFWQGLKFPDEADRERLAELAGHAARTAGPKSEPGDRVVYQGREIVVGTVDHWELMERANMAKFEQDEEARAALLSTGSRRLVHQVPVDSRTIPGVVMADIWMRIRDELADE